MCALLCVYLHTHWESQVVAEPTILHLISFPLLLSSSPPLLLTTQFRLARLSGFYLISPIIVDAVFGHFYLVATSAVASTFVVVVVVIVSCCCIVIVAAFGVDVCNDSITFIAS